MYVLRIAGHTIGISGEAEEMMLKGMSGFGVFVSQEAPEWEVAFGCDVRMGEYRMLYGFEFEGGDVDCRFGRDGEDYVFEMIPKKGDMLPLRMRYDGGSRVEADRAANATLLRFGLWMAFVLMGMKRGVMPIHASVVVHRGRRRCFSGNREQGRVRTRAYG